MDMTKTFTPHVVVHVRLDLYVDTVYPPRLYESLENGHIHKLRASTLQAGNLPLHRLGVSCTIWRREHIVI